MLATITWASDPDKKDSGARALRPTLPRVTEEAIAAYLERVPEPARSALAELCRIIAASDPRVCSKTTASVSFFTRAPHAGARCAGSAAEVVRPHS